VNAQGGKLGIAFWTLRGQKIRSDLIELSTRQNFVHWLAIGVIYRGWARSASGNTAEGIALIEQGIRDYRATGAVTLVGPLDLTYVNGQNPLSQRHARKLVLEVLDKLLGTTRGSSRSDSPHRP
jgi:hypothetical protein